MLELKKPVLLKIKINQTGIKYYQIKLKHNKFI